MAKEVYIYREFNNTNGDYKENMNITKEFEDFENLLNYINERKMFYTKTFHTRKIEIEIIQKGEQMMWQRIF